MNYLDPSKYGYARRDGYSITTDLALLRVGYQSAWSRQRRSYIHNASLATISFVARTKTANELNAFLQAQPSTDFFLCPLISGNDQAEPCSISDVEIRRTSDVATERVPMTDYFIVSFEAETREFTGYQAVAAAAANKPPSTYPAGLPLPSADGFTSVQGKRNVTVYSLNYSMSGEKLADWLAFAGYVGTAWFLHPIVSVNVPCGYEFVRYVSNPAQTLVAPNVFSVSVECETMPSTGVIDLVIETTGECTYNGLTSYDDETEIYDCTGTPPPQGDFVVPAGLVSISHTVTGLSPQTSTCLIKFNRDGSVVSSPASSPAWAAWHTAPQTLPRAAITSDAVMEFSINAGATWQYTTPVAGGFWISLKNYDVWFRKVLTTDITREETLAFKINIEADHLPTPTLNMVTNMSFFNRCVVTYDAGSPSPIVNGITYTDGFTISNDGSDPPRKAYAGIIFRSDGTTAGRTGGEFQNWYETKTTGIGENLYLLLLKDSGANSIAWEGARRHLVSNYIGQISGLADDTGVSSCSWYGRFEIWNAPTGGEKVGGGFLNLASSVTL